MSKYHNGITVRESREKRRMTQAQLAEVWPKDDGGIGVSVGFVQLVEAGKKTIDSDRTKRGLCDILHIEHWRFGLSEYDPHNPDQSPKNKRLVDETLDLVEYSIHRFEDTYRTAPLPVAAADAKQLHNLFEYIKQHQPPTIQNEKRFLRLYAQTLNLDGIVFIGYEEYDKALQTFREMNKVAEQLGEPTWIAHSLLTIGVELHRAGYLLRQAGATSDWTTYIQEAIQYLERARDVTFHTSKNVAAYVHAYLARMYGTTGDDYHFERAINTALALAPDSYGDGTDFVYHRLSGILAEKSYGFLDLGRPEKTLAMREEIEEQIKTDNNNRLAAWVPLDWAKAYKMQGKIEESVEEGRDFYRQAQAMQSPHIIKRAKRFANGLLKDHKDVQVVKDFYEEVNSGGGVS
ncbi:MAG TPA: helix-turn-helix transcriptional regulator [Ktedonobacteraceae bacterium]|nr:helix-turn-helix transcriptional regulator [Ktedonobacteraceae bacterium]